MGLATAFLLRARPAVTQDNHRAAGQNITDPDLINVMRPDHGGR